MTARLLLIATLLLLAAGTALAAYRADPPIGGTLVQSATEVRSGDRVSFEARTADEDSLVDSQGLVVSTVTDPVRISWSVSGGTILSRDPSTSNPNRMVWSAPGPGQYTITARADDVGSRPGANDAPWQSVAVVTVRSVQPAVGELTVRVEPDRLPADGRSTARVTARLGDLRGLEGRLVRFTATLGTVTGSATTDRLGVASATLRAPTSAGIGTVAASSGNLVARAFVEFVPQGRPYPYYPVPMPVLQGQVLLTASPSSLPADGASTTTINIIVLDPLGRAVALQPVWLAATAGAITNYTVTGIYGRAMASLRATTQPGTALVTAWTSLGSGQAAVQFNAIMVKLTPNQDQAPADGKAVVRLVARVTDSNGSPVADGTQVTFASTEGPGTRVNTVGGIAAAQITAPEKPERAVVTASALGASDQATINFVRPEPEVTTPSPVLRLAVNPSVLAANGKATANVTVLLVGPDDKPLADRQVRLATTAGTIEESVTTDREGRATATLRAPNEPAEALVTAQVEGTVAALTVRFR